MRLLFLSVLLAAAAVASVRAADTPITGKWQVHVSIAGNESDAECAFTQKDNDLTGSCKTSQGESKAVGKVDGKKISWSYDSEYTGSPLTVKYDGTLDSAAAKITGTVRVEQFGVDGEFTATLTK
jgi:hypothetical protein